MVRRLLPGQVAGIEELPGGAGIRVTCRVGRDGVKEYQTTSGAVRREYLSKENLLATALQLKDAPVTGYRHPRTEDGLIRPEDWKQHAIGHVSEVLDVLQPHAGHNWAIAKIVVNDPRAIADIRAGNLCETSLGQVTDATAYGPGGHGYDAEAPAGVPNHFTILPKNGARAGNDSRVLLDSNDNEVDTLDLAEFLKQIAAEKAENAKLQAQLADAQAQLTAARAPAPEAAQLVEAQAAIAKLTAERDAARAVDVGALVRDELAFRAELQPALPSTYDFGSKSRAEVRADALRHLGGTVVADASEDFVRGALAVRLDAKAQSIKAAPVTGPKTPDQIRAEKRAAQGNK